MRIPAIKEINISEDILLELRINFYSFYFFIFCYFILQIFSFLLIYFCEFFESISVVFDKISNCLSVASF